MALRRSLDRVDGVTHARPRGWRRGNDWVRVENADRIRVPIQERGKAPGSLGSGTVDGQLIDAPVPSPRIGAFARMMRAGRVCTRSPEVNMTCTDPTQILYKIHERAIGSHAGGDASASCQSTFLGGRGSIPTRQTWEGASVSRHRGLRGRGVRVRPPHMQGPHQRTPPPRRRHGVPSEAQLNFHTIFPSFIEKAVT